MLTRLIPVLEGFVHYRNPVHITLKRLMARPDSVMTITDRKTGVTVVASANSYHMFGETWYAHDYDVPGCPIRPGDLVLDIGAHQGFFTCYAASKGATVHAFEPFPGSFSRLLENVERNGFERLVRASPQAVSNVSGTATMRCFDYLGGGANTIVDSHLPDTTPNAVVTVPTLAINSSIESASGRIRLCKIDCESSELDIVKGISDPSAIDSFAIEFHPHAYPLDELVTAMMAWGTHQVSFSRTANVLYAVAPDCLHEHALLR